MLIREKLPSMEHFIEYKKNYKLEKTKLILVPISAIIASPKITKLSPTMKVLSHSPYIKSLASKTLTPVVSKYLPLKEEAQKQEDIELSEGDSSPVDIVIPIMNTNPSTLQREKTSNNEDINMNAKRMPNASYIDGKDKLKERKVDINISPSQLLQRRVVNSSMAICLCGKICEIKNTQCSECLAQSGIGKPITGYLYIKTENKLKRFWLKMINKCLYLYENIKDEEHKLMTSLQGAIVRDEVDESIDSKTVIYPFSIFNGSKDKVYYALKVEEKNKWLKSIREAIGCFNLQDYYDIKEVIGRGKFGLVKSAFHKKTHKSVAVKIMKKKDMTDQDSELMRREIEILKICQHPNIIQLIDIFENSDYMFIVMEHLKGGDLFTYLEKRKFHISEERSASIIYSILVALTYLHSYGIAHRDLKPENILLNTISDNSDIKIMDFGLSKIIAPDERSIEPFGTLSYVAPEILKMRPYGKNVDLWSVGVISYLLLCGVLPYDDEKDSNIAKMIVECEPNYSFGRWKTTSDESLDFTKKLLVKDKDKRMGLEEALKHPWIQMNKVFIMEVRKNGNAEEEFNPIFLKSN